MFITQFANATWWDNNWIFRQEIIINSSLNTSSNYQILIELNSSNVGENFNWTNEKDTLRFVRNSTILSYWIQEYNQTSEKAYIWVKTDTNISTNGYSMHMYYGNKTIVSSLSNASNTFRTNSIHLSVGRCTDTSNCNGMDNHAEADSIRSQIGTGTYTLDGTGYVTSINQNSNPYGTQDYYYMRHRFLFIPSTSGSYTFATNSDDGSEATFFPFDGYGGGLRTTHPFGAHDIIAYWYGLHGTGTCGTSGTRETRILSAGEGYWIDYLMNEWTGGQLAQMCTRIGAGSFNIINTGNFPNQLFAREYISPEPIVSSIEEEENIYGKVSILLNSPQTLFKNYVLQNNTLSFDFTIFCNGLSNISTCGNLSIMPKYNNTLSDYTNVSNIPATNPMWTSSVIPSNCVLDINQNCTLNYFINFTGEINSYRKIKIFSQSNYSLVSNASSNNNWLVWIIDTNIVSFNQSFYNFTSFYKNQGSKTKILKVVSNIGINNNIRVWCDFGDCDKISQNWINGTNLIESEERNIDFTCSDTDTGNYSATFKIISDDNPFTESIQINCEINQAYGPIKVFLNNPLPLSNIVVPQNQTFKINASVECVGICGNISAFAIYTRNDWWDTSWNYRQRLNISIYNATPSNYQILINLNETNLGNNFDWSNNCNDIRFIKDSNELFYWIENCDSIKKELFVWVKTNSALNANSYFDIYMYYKNNLAISKSNASATFRTNSVFSLTGRCSGTGNCDMDNHVEADTLRANINTTGMIIDAYGYTNGINDMNNPYGTDDNYYSRYRVLFIPSITASYSFGTFTDDDSEVTIFPFDGYGNGFRTTHPFGPHDVITTQYGTWHQNNACGSTPAIKGTRNLVAGKGYWLDFLHIEGTGGQAQVMCLNSGSGYTTFTSANFPNQLYARTYVFNEPKLQSISNEEDFQISTNSSQSPFFTFNSQPQSCLAPEDGTCSFEWLVNASGPVNTTWNISVLFFSNYSFIAKNITSYSIINISSEIIPKITLYEVSNATKIIYKDNISFKWFIEDDSPSLNCSLFLNNILKKNDTCLSFTNTTWNLDIEPGFYNWFVNLTDENNNTVKSEIWSFYAIKNYSAKIEKSIFSENVNMYKIKIISKNLINSIRNFTLFEFSDSSFNYGSFNIPFNITNSTNGIYYNGNILGWHLNFNNNSSQEINYSIAGINDYYLKKNYIIGLD